jgi:predicted ATP-dependent endonuclease of OLD family
MHIRRAIVQNYKVLRNVRIDFGDHLNIIVGDNESGKSTLLEAINLALSGQVNGRNISYEMHPHIFNGDAVQEYLEQLRNGGTSTLPSISIELYLSDEADLARLKGTNNSLREDSPGITFTIEFDESFEAEYAEYIKNPSDIRSVPVEYYKISWFSFANGALTSRGVPIKPTLIDASALRYSAGANKYILDIMSDYLSTEQRVQLSLSYRKLKDTFLEDLTVQGINQELSQKKGKISHKNISVSLDTTSRANWENALMPQLDQIPLPLIGKGEQSSIKIKLAMEASADAHMFLIEEPENHLSHHNLNKLIKHVSENSSDKQLLVTTHSNFVLNKLGLDNVILFNGQTGITLRELTPETQDYFTKLPGYDTLRLILAEKAILVEGPSDELIVQKAFQRKHQCHPLERGIDVICVNSLAFKRFLEIAKILKRTVVVITDNDGDLDALQSKYADYFSETNIKISYDTDTSTPSLEQQLLKANDRDTLNTILGKSYSSDNDLLGYMQKNKTDCALAIFNADLNATALNFPGYINDVI